MSEAIDSKTFYEIAVSLAKEAGGYQKSRVADSLKIEYKGDINLVTEVDKKCEQMIVRGLQEKFPDHDIMAEEGSGDRKDSPYKWIIDPLDGTTNFAHGYPLFAVSIGLEYKGGILGGVVYDPMRDELFSGFQGEGAFLNGNQIGVSKADKIERSMLATGFAYNIRQTKDNNLNHFENMLLNAQAVRRDGVAAIDICYVACGRYDGFWELNLFPWDTAAGIIIAVEAGGLVTRFDGSPFTVYEKDILVTNSTIHDEMVKMLKKGMKRRRFS